MIEVEYVVPWSAMERAADPEPASGDIDVVASDLGRAVRFYSRVFGLLPARGAWGDSFAIIPVNSSTRLIIHDARAAVRRRARCVRRWAFVVTDLEHIRDMVWELGVKVARDSGAPDHIYRWSNGRSLYVQAPDGHEIELVEITGQALDEAPARAAAS
jgi:catechol 2,3-dioxygenase-like lactoylglutathione lyase family enzyme